MVATGEDLVAAVGQMNLQSILQITAETVEPVTSQKLDQGDPQPQNTVESL